MQCTVQYGRWSLIPLTETNQDMVEDAVKYVIFLVDVDKLFDTALGMYDFALVLLIAQQSQRVCSACGLMHSSL